MISKIIHHIWPSDGDIIPSKYQRCIDSWKVFHPDWQYNIWRIENLPKELMREEVYNIMLNPRLTVTLKSDVLRLEICRIYGGLYLDTDMECLKDITGLLDTDLLCGYEDGDKAIGTSLIGCDKNHPIICKALDTALYNVRNNKPREAIKNILKCTGPGMFTKICKEENVNAYPQHIFYLYNNQYDDRSYSRHQLTSHQPEGWLFQNKFSVPNRLRIIIIKQPFNSEIRKSIMTQDVAENKHFNIVNSMDEGLEIAKKYNDRYNIFIDGNVLLLDKNCFNDMIEYVEDNNNTYVALGEYCFLIRGELNSKNVSGELDDTGRSKIIT